jgi:hypothetical protein
MHPSVAATRRSLHVLSRLSVLAVAVVMGTTLMATPGDPKAHVASQEHQLTTGTAGKGFSSTLDDVGIDAEMIGFTWTGRTSASIDVRAVVDGGWSDWVHLEGSPDEAPDVTSPESQPTMGAGPAWLGHDFRTVQVRVTGGSAPALRLHAIDTEPPSGGGLLGIDAAGAVPAWPPVIMRAQWGADESWRTVSPDPECNGVPRYASEVRFGIVHHTATSNDYAPADSAAQIRGIYYFHTHDRGWCDIAYNFVVDRYGQVFEGRAGGIYRAVTGGHAGGFNSGSTGISVLGDFTSTPVPAATYSALRRLLAWKLGYHGIDPRGSTVEVSGGGSAKWPAGTVVSLPRLEGHRDSNATSCPGQHLYDLLPRLRQDVARDIENAADSRLVCDWDGDGDDTPAFVQDGVWYLRNRLGEALPDNIVHYGIREYIPVCGDWDGNGTDTIGVYHEGNWWLRNANGPGPPDLAISYGMAGYTPVVGDWDGDGDDNIGVYVGDTWYLRDSNDPGPATTTVRYGANGWKPVVGDWNNDGRDGLGVFTSGYWYLRNALTPGRPDVTVYPYGIGGDRPIAGDWNDDGYDTIGISRGAYWWMAAVPRTGSDVVFPY